jgi:hypothetical protein
MSFSPLERGFTAWRLQDALAAVKLSGLAGESAKSAETKLGRAGVCFKTELFSSIKLTSLGGVMRKVGWYLATLAALTLTLAVSAAAPQRMRVGDIRGLISGNLIIEPDQTNPLPIGRGGYPLGFAFAPGRPELAYCALEQEPQGFVSALRLVQLENLWPVTRTRMVTRQNRRGESYQVPENYLVELPFAQRERELYKKTLPLSPPDQTANYLSGPILWCPDGARFALFSLQGEFFKPPVKKDLWLIDCATGQKRELTRGALVTEAVWSPDGKWLAYITRADKASGGAPAGMWLAAAGEGPGQCIGGAAPALNWTADSSRLCFQGASGEGQAYSPATGKTTPYSSVASPLLPWQISPNGKYRARVANSQLEIRDRGTGARVLNLPGKEFGCWYPDSTLFAYFDAGGKLTITALNGMQQGHLLGIEEPADPSPVPGLPSVQWSSPALIVREGESGPEAPKHTVSWLALLEGGRLQALRLKHRPPSLHEGAVLHPPTPEEEQGIILSSMRQIALATLMYADDYDETFAPQKNVEKAVLPYMMNSELFDRPGYPKQPIFRYLTDALPVAAIEYPADTPLWQVDLGGKQICLGFADGHARWYDREAGEEILRRAGIPAPPAPKTRLH